MSGFSTQTSQMATTAARVTATSGEIGSLLSSLRAEVATAPAHFKGAAAITFQQLMAQYDLDAAKLRDALTGIAEQIGAASRTYASQDETQSAALRASGSGLHL